MLVLLSHVYAVPTDVSTKEAAKLVEEESALSPTLELIKDWRILTTIVIMLSIILVSIASMFGRAFDMPDLQAWAAEELKQVFATAIIMIVFMVVLTTLDFIIAKEVVEPSNLGYLCGPTENCGIKTADKYMDGLIDIAKASAKNAIKEQVNANKLSALSFGLSCSQFIKPIPCLQLAYSQSYTVGGIMDAERYAVIIEYDMLVLTGLMAQKFFIHEFAYKLGPVILVLGILGRAFFATRKLGGLLIAIAIGVMYIFPFMYIVNWITLNVALFGDSILVPKIEGECPQECNRAAPLFYDTTNEEVIGHKYGLDLQNIIKIKGKIKIYDISDAADYLGTDKADEENMQEVIKSAEKGDPSEISGNGKVLKSCAADPNAAICPKECREIPYPMIPLCVENETTKKACNDMPEDCKIIRFANISKDEKDPNGNLMCPLECRVIPPTNNTAAAANKYLVPGTPDLNPKLDIEASCGTCIFVQKAYTYNPPLSTALDCSQLCSPNPIGPPKISPAQFTKKSKEMMLGTDEIKEVSSLMLPAYVLLLLNIVVTLMFIKTFSPMLGGDIDIPGLRKIM